MTPRRKLSLREQLAIMVRQARCACGCNDKLGLLSETEFHHLHELALGGADAPDNIVAVKSACHNRITNGTKATSAGSSKHVIAKSKRLARVNEDFARLVLAKPCGQKRAKTGRWPTGRKIIGRPRLIAAKVE